MVPAHKLIGFANVIRLENGGVRRRGRIKRSHSAAALEGGARERWPQCTRIFRA